MASSNALIVDHLGTKKRRMLCIVVSRLSALSVRLMLLDYQIRLDFASGTRSRCRDRITNQALHPIRTVHLHGLRQLFMLSIWLSAFRIHRIIHRHPVNAGGHGGPPLRRNYVTTSDIHDFSWTTRCAVECGAGGPEAESVATRKSKTSVYR